MYDELLLGEEYTQGRHVGIHCEDTERCQQVEHEKKNTRTDRHVEATGSP